MLHKIIPYNIGLWEAFLEWRLVGSSVSRVVVSTQQIKLPESGPASPGVTVGQLKRLKSHLKPAFISDIQ